MSFVANITEVEFHQVMKNFNFEILKWRWKFLDHQIDEQIKQKKDFEAKYQRATDTIAQLRREIGDLQSKYNARFEFSTFIQSQVQVQKF